MLDQPSKEPAAFEFDPFLRVLCLSQISTIKSLQWVLDRRSFSGKKIQLFPGQLSEIQGAELEADLVLMTLDLGQKVPVENLKKLTRISGLCALEQPTPAQLLQLLELGNWEATTWDGSTFEQLADRLEESVTRHLEGIKEREFLQSCRSWILHHEKEAGQIEWLNPPENFRGPQIYLLDPYRGALSLGAAQSGADIRLPTAGAEEYCVFEFRNQNWQINILEKSRSITYRAQDESLVLAGDVLEIGEYQFQIKRLKRLEEISSLARRLGFLKAKNTFHLRKGLEGTLADLCKELLFSGLNGELRVASELKNGAIYFVDGAIVQAVTGAVSGIKALLRMLGWEKPNWKFNVDRSPPALGKRLSIGPGEFPRLHQNWLKKWQEVGAMVPPSQLRLQAHREKFLGRAEWSAQETQVLAAICEYALVRDILNNCPLQDIEIFETLVSLRKQGLIEIQSH